MSANILLDSLIVVIMINLNKYELKTDQRLMFHWMKYSLINEWGFHSSDFKLNLLKHETYYAQKAIRGKYQLNRPRSVES